MRGERLDACLAHEWKDLSRSRIRDLIGAGRVRLGGAVAKPAHRLRGGERVELELPLPTPATPQAERLPIVVLHEDRDLLVLDKAAGMVVHPAAGNWTGTLVNALLHHVGDLQGVGGQLRPGLVHRLDKDTSGCLVVAKSDAVLQALQAAFKSREVEKVYLTLVHGVPPGEGTLRTPYGRHPKHRQRVTGRLKEGKPAVTHFRVLERFEGAALLEVSLETGRTHQIRVHLSEAGYPLLGDALYGAGRKRTARAQDAAEAVGRQALHAARLSFVHPRTRRLMTFEAPLPPDFARGLKLLRA